MGWDFNSLCIFNGQPLGSNESGIFELDKGNDFNGTDIDAFFRTHLSDWGISNVKRVRSAYVGYETTGNIQLIVRDDENNAETYTLFSAITKQQGEKISLKRTNQGRYYNFEIHNVDGSDFSIDTLEVIPVILGRKSRSYQSPRSNGNLIFPTPILSGNME